MPLSINRDFASDDTFLVTETQVNADGVHVWPFDPAFPVDALLHSLSGTRPFRMNRHDYFELVYLISGELVWQVQDSFVTQSNGDLFVMTSPNVSQGYGKIGTESGRAVAVLRPQPACLGSWERL